MHTHTHTHKQTAENVISDKAVGLLIAEEVICRAEQKTKATSSVN